MMDATEDFFFNLRRRGHDQRLEIGNGSVRFDISGDGRTEHWLVELRDGNVMVTQAGVGGEAVVRADREVFNRIVSGQAYFLTTVLRGDAQVEGSPHLFAIIRRLFPPPPVTRQARDRAGEVS